MYLLCIKQIIWKYLMISRYHVRITMINYSCCISKFMLFWINNFFVFYFRYKTKKIRHQSNYEGKNWSTEPSYQNIISIPFLLILTKQIISSLISQPKCSRSLSFWCSMCRLKWRFLNILLLLQLLTFFEYILKSDSFKPNGTMNSCCSWTPSSTRTEEQTLLFFIYTYYLC